MPRTPLPALAPSRQPEEPAAVPGKRVLHTPSCQHRAGGGTANNLMGWILYHHPPARRVLRADWD